MTITTVGFDPDKKRIEDIFSGSLQLVIPRYQRTYSWPKEKSEEFFSDFLEESEKAEDNLAFLGTILFALTADGSLEVIDGQQRLITITIFFAALRDLLVKQITTSQAQIAADHIQKSITINSTFGSSYSSSENNKYKLKVGVEIEQIFTEIIYGTTRDIRLVKPRNIAERRVLDSYNFFARKLKDILLRPGLTSEQSVKIADNLLTRINAIEYIDIRVTNKEVAYNLFESHNAKGVALAKTDLIKNYYFGRLSGTDDEKNKKMDEWDALLDDLTDSTTNMLPDRFFYYMLQSYEGNFPSSNLYRRIKPRMDDHQKFFSDMKRNIQSMINLKNSNTNDREINRILFALNKKLKVNQCFILLLCLYRNSDKLHRPIYNRIYALIEEFTYVYSGVTKSPGNALEKIYSKHAKKIEDSLKPYKKQMSDIDRERVTGKILKDLKRDLDELCPTFSVFAEAFSELRYSNQSNKNIIRYTFEKIEYHHSKGVILLSDAFTLDHIVPQKKNKGGLYDSIGNLVPMSQANNSAKGSNEAMSDDYMDISNFLSVKTVRELLEKNDFGEEEIQERMKYLAKYAYNEAFANILNK